MNALGSGVKKFLWQAWRIIRWPILLCIVGYCVLFIYVAATSPARTKAAVEAIHTQRLTMADVDGKHLPPPPDPKLVDATVEGIDANKNGIRDDVELAIFKKYPNDIKIRAAELQYAMELQHELSENINNSEIWTANAIAEDRGYLCISETYPRDNLQNYIRVTDERSKEVEKLVFNSGKRLEARVSYGRHETSYALPNNDFCDVIF